MRRRRINRQEAVGLARSFRRVSTGAEAALWKVLRGRRLGGLKFRRQHPVDGFMVDFYCAERRLIVEVDGSIHDRQRGADVDCGLRRNDEAVGRGRGGRGGSPCPRWSKTVDGAVLGWQDALGGWWSRVVSRWELGRAG